MIRIADEIEEALNVMEVGTRSRLSAEQFRFECEAAIMAVTEQAHILKRMILVGYVLFRRPIPRPMLAMGDAPMLIIWVDDRLLPLDEAVAAIELPAMPANTPTSEEPPPAR